MSPRRLFRSSTTARQKAAELDEEIRTHLEMRADDLVRDGWSPDSAWDEALRRFGPLDEARQTLSKAGKARDRRLRFHAFVDGVRADLALGDPSRATGIDPSTRGTGSDLGAAGEHRLFRRASPARRDGPCTGAR